MKKATPDDQDASFWEFFSEVFVPLNNLALPLKPAHKIVCDALQRSVHGDLGKQFVIVNIPPRIGKTKILEALVCWQVAYFPDSQFIMTSYSADLAETSLRYVKSTLQNPWFKDMFGDYSGTVAKADLVNTNHGGNIYASGNAGTLTGKGGGLKRKAGGFISIDDPAKPTEALSPVEAENVREWFELTLKSRRNSDEHCPIIICAQRLALDDLCGYLLYTYPDDCFHIKIPALHPVTEESQFPETYSTENLKASRDSTQSNIRFGYWSQMQQEPISKGGNLINIDNFVPYENPHTLMFERLVITADTALKAKESADNSVLQLWGKMGPKAYLIDQIYGKWESPELLANAKMFWAKHKEWKLPNEQGVIYVSKLTIEEAASGIGLIQQLNREGIPAQGVIRTKDKVTRVQEVLPYISTGMVYVPKEATFRTAFLSECAAFRPDGNAPHDDQVDCMCQALTDLLISSVGTLELAGMQKRKRYAY